MTRRLGEPKLLHPWGAECELAPEAVTAFAGVARPDAFFDELERTGWRVASRTRFADHHRYSRRDLSRLFHQAERDGASMLITTEKDAVRIEPLRPVLLPIAWAPLEVTVEPAAAFHEAVCGAC
jgi:tetraacyldisaccharide 4'-kinase